MAYYSLSNGNNQLVCIIYGERKDIEEYYKNKEFILKGLKIIKDEFNIAIPDQNTELSNLYQILYDSFMPADYILAPNMETAIKKYYGYCYSNLIKHLIRDDIIRQVKVVVCREENDKIVLKF